MIDSIFIYLFPVKERKMKHSDGYLEVCENYFSGLLSPRVILMPSDIYLLSLYTRFLGKLRNML